MKNTNFKLHNVVNGSNYLRPLFHYIKIENGILWGTDGTVIFKIPFELIFKNCSKFNGYLKGDDWKKQQFYKAAKFEQIKNQLQAWDFKNKDLGRITIFTEDQMVEDQMVKNDRKFPNCSFLEGNFVNNAVNAIRFNPEKLYRLVEAMGEEFHKVKILFNDVNKAIKVECSNGAIGFLMPIKFD